MNKDSSFEQVTDLLNLWKSKSTQVHVAFTDSRAKFSFVGTVKFILGSDLEFSVIGALPTDSMCIDLTLSNPAVHDSAIVLQWASDNARCIIKAITKS